LPVVLCLLNELHPHVLGQVSEELNIEAKS
jgi:hypothetical protein